MKKRNVVLGLLLSFVCLFSFFGLAGCGEASIKTITENFTKLDETYAKYDTVFVEGEVGSQQTLHKVYFGKKIQNYMTADPEYAELEDLYNLTLAISNQYIDQNRNYIESGVKEGDLDGNARKKLDTFNKNLVAFEKAIPAFATARDSFAAKLPHYDGANTNESFNHGDLQDFKIVFGKLVEKNVKLSTSFADAVEATKIYDALGQIALQPEDTGIVKEFICAKMLHIFTDLRISQISNNLMWSTIGKDTETKNDKDLIDNLLEKTKTQFETFESQFVSKPKEYRELSKEEYAKVFEMTNEFLIEADAYTQAVEDFKVVDFAKKSGLSFQKHKEKVKLAEVYLQKMDQFLSITLPKYMENVLKLIYV